MKDLGKGKVSLGLVLCFLLALPLLFSMGLQEATQVAPQVAAGYAHTVGLKSDGTVIAVGNNFFQQCDVNDPDDWTGIIATTQ